MLNDKKLLILGAGPYAEEIADMASLIPGMQVEGFVEGNDRNRCEYKLLGKNIYWIDEIAKFRSKCKAICAVGATERDKFIAQAKDLGLNFTSLISASAYIPPSVSIGEGVIVGPGCAIGSFSSIGNHTILTRGAMIGHHVDIGDFCTLSAGVNVGGKTTIFERCFIGIGAIIFDHISVGTGSVVGAGSTVNKDVPVNVMVLGNPAQIYRKM